MSLKLFHLNRISGESSSGKFILCLKHNIHFFSHRQEMIFSEVVYQRNYFAIHFHTITVKMRCVTYQQIKCCSFGTLAKLAQMTGFNPVASSTHPHFIITCGRCRNSCGIYLRNIRDLIGFICKSSRSWKRTSTFILMKAKGEGKNKRSGIIHRKLLLVFVWAEEKRTF